LKKLIAMALLVSHLFSTGGNVLLHKYLSDTFFNGQTSKNKYIIIDITKAKTPIDSLNLTYCATFGKVRGKIQFDKAKCNYVQMRTTCNATYLTCVSNYQTTKFSTWNVLLAKGIKNIPVPKKNHIPSIKLNLNEKAQVDFNHSAFNIPIQYLKTIALQPTAKLLSNTLRIPEEPPKADC